MNRRRFTRLAAALAAVPALPFAPRVAAQGAQKYVLIEPPMPTFRKLEVIEFFWYECPHCYDLEPSLEAWVKKLPKDVAFRRVPATFNERWNISARVYYTLETMGLLDKLHGPLFTAVHKERLRITDDRALADWLAKNGVDTAKFQQIYKSDDIGAKLKTAQNQVAASRIDGVPALVVNGRYLIAAGGGVSSHTEMLQVADQLLAQARTGAAAPAPGQANAKK